MKFFQRLHLATALLIFTFSLAIVFCYNNKTEAQTSVIAGSLTGYAWSENIGWISMSGSGYGVTVDENGFLHGYAWSENIGWIKFGDFSSCPVTNCVVDTKIVSTPTPHIIGWARACAGTVNGDCTGASRDDGWDGWISLSGVSTSGDNYGLNLNINGDFIYQNSYAWGSDVVGWVDFGPVSNVDSGGNGSNGSKISCNVTDGYYLKNGICTACLVNEELSSDKTSCVCKSGYEKNALNVCSLISTNPVDPQSNPDSGNSIKCKGVMPSGVGVIKDLNAISDSLSTNPAWQYISVGSSVASCKWTCKTGYKKSGNTCVVSDGTIQN